MISKRSLVGLLAVAVLVAGSAAEAADIQTITHGREVDLEAHLVTGKYVLFDFYADWCGPCRALEPQLVELAGRHASQLALRKVDIINWDSAVSRQYRVSSIPYMVLYGPDGSRIAAGDAGTVIRHLQSSLGNGTGFSLVTDHESTLIPLLVVATIFAVTLAFVVRKRRTSHTTSTAVNNASDLPSVNTAANPGDPAIWFALLQGSLEGPFTRDQLGELVRRTVLDRKSTVRRRGDASWTAINDVLD